MSRYLLRRSVHALATVVIAVVLIFLAVRALPGNPVLARLGQHATPGRVAEAMQRQGWDRPWLAQLGDFLTGLARGDLGNSFVLSPGETVIEILARCLPATIELALAAMLLAAPLGVTLGVAAAVWRRRWPDVAATSLSLLGVSTPVFFLGIVLLSLFPHMPTGLRLPPTVDVDFATGFYLLEALVRGQWGLLGLGLRQICLPALALSTIPMAVIARITRSSMLDVLAADYVRSARAKGASRWRVVWRHALPNAAVPIANIAGFQLGLLLSGAVLTETVFSWPGLGRQLVDAVKASDYSVVQGGALAIAALFVGLNLALDLLYAWLDPRIRFS